MYHIRIADDIAVCLINGVPGYAVLCADLGEIITCLDGIGVAAAAGRGTDRYIKHQVAGTIVRVNTVIFVPELLFSLFARGRPVYVEYAVALTQRVSCTVLIR